MHPVKRLKLILADVRQQRIDVESWNANRSDAPPFDLGRYLVMERATAEAIRAWDTPEFPEKLAAFNKLAEKFSGE